ncbi:MAG: hypothetical protein Phog2KO_42980 [Phototrophicaceae bacterium]
MGVISTIARVLRPILDFPIIKRVRQNHAYEHATIHMLNRQNYILSGRASLGGFVVMGNVPTAKVQVAAEEALSRLKRGQKQLALHPNCGTNLVTAGLMSTSIAAVGFMGTSRKSAWERFPIIMLLMMITILYSTPIGMVVQEHITTESNPGEMQLVQVKRGEMKLPFRSKPIVVHNIVTK